jgi:hypothetical protein
VTSRLHLRLRIDPDPATSVTSPQRHRDTEPSHGATADHADERRSHRASHHHIVATTTARRHEDAARPCSGRHPCLPSGTSFQKRESGRPGTTQAKLLCPPHHDTPLPPPKKERDRPGTTQAEPLCSEHSGRGSGRTRRTLAFGTAGRSHGGGGRRPSPTPPSSPPAMNAMSSCATPSRLRAFALATPAMAATPAMNAITQQCDGSAQSTRIRVHPRPKNAMNAMTSRLRAFVVATPAMTQKCDVSVPLCAPLCLCGSTATLRRTTDP